MAHLRLRQLFWASTPPSRTGLLNAGPSDLGKQRLKPNQAAFGSGSTHYPAFLHSARLMGFVIFSAMIGKKLVMNAMIVVELKRELLTMTFAKKRCFNAN